VGGQNEGITAPPHCRMTLERWFEVEGRICVKHQFMNSNVGMSVLVDIYI
jgi:hypothetical protein